MKYLGLILVLFCGNVQAGEWWLTTSLYTKHFDNDWDYNERQNLVGIEYRDKKLFASFNYFDNSYGDKSRSIFGGIISKKEHVSFKLGLGVAYGYDEKYCKYGESYEYVVDTPTLFYRSSATPKSCKKTKASMGYLPILAQSISFNFKSVSVEAVLISFDAAMINFGIKIH